MAITESQINESQTFDRTPLVDLPVKEPRKVPRVRPNPFVQKEKANAFDRKHHTVVEPPSTVQDAIQST
jgi:hypothetical protein